MIIYIITSTISNVHDYIEQVLDVYGRKSKKIIKLLEKSLKIFIKTDQLFIVGDTKDVSIVMDYADTIVDYADTGFSSFAIEYLRENEKGCETVLAQLESFEQEIGIENLLTLSF